MSNILLTKRQVIERLQSPLSSRDKVIFLKWQKENLIKSIATIDKTRFNNYKEWLDIQININNKIVSNDTFDGVLEK